MRALLAVLFLLLLAPAVAGAQTPDPPGHDPTLIREGGYVYALTTGTYLPLQRTEDLVHWEPAGAVFAAPPAWLVRELGMVPAALGAPDVSYFGGRYHVYYAVSQAFGLNESLIGHVTNATLDPEDPAYAWRDEGMVVRSTVAADFNAIDPDVALDAKGTPWLSYGSFWTGLKLMPLDRATGAPAGPPQPIAARPFVNAIEAPSIVHRGGWYYLFASFDFCCRGVDSDYRVVVGRSRHVTGPYVDRAGLPMLAGGGTDLLSGHGRYAGTGHQDVLLGEFGDLLVHHYYDRDAAGQPRLSLRDLRWAGGWPAVGAPLSELHPEGRRPARWRAPPADAWRPLATPFASTGGAFPPQARHDGSS